MRINDFYERFYPYGDHLREVLRIPPTPTRENYAKMYTQKEDTIPRIHKLQWRRNHIFDAYATAYCFEGLHGFNLNENNYKSRRHREYKASRLRKPFPYSENVILDRLFFDFDMTHEQILKAENVAYDKDDLDDIDAKLKTVKENETEILSDATFEEKLDYFYRKFNESIYFRQPLEDAKRVSKMFKEQYGLDSVLVFTGSKGVHLYPLFHPIRIKYATEVIRFIGEAIARQLKTSTLDPHVLYLSTKSRIPFTYNTKTNMTAIPFNENADYFSIIDESHKMSKEKAKDSSFQLESSFRFPRVNDSTKIHELLREGEAYFTKRHQDEERRRNQSRILTHKGYNIEHRNQITIKNPQDVEALHQFPCFNQLDLHNRTDLITFVGFLSFTHLETAEEVQEANIRFWKSRGGHLKRSKKGLYQTESVFRKYYLTSNSMRRRGYCMDCPQGRCFRHKLRMRAEYYANFSNPSQN